MNEQHEVLREQGLDREFWIIDGEVDDGRVEVALEEATDQTAGGSLRDHGSQSGEVGGQLGQQCGHHPATGGTDHPDPGGTRHIGVPGGHLSSDLLEFSLDPSGSFDHLEPLLGEPATVAVHQRDAELFLEVSEVPGDV
ncbi:unannotated protein [freshwater metagenome]|uniref:Unannotated protein n=1 Tax=freshwater metagenome TaxID=449393 RepID=A0A6J6PY68_9ZZZZ